MASRAPPSQETLTAAGLAEKILLLVCRGARLIFVHRDAEQAEGLKEEASLELARLWVQAVRFKIEKWLSEWLSREVLGRNDYYIFKLCLLQNYRYKC